LKGLGTTMTYTTAQAFMDQFDSLKDEIAKLAEMTPEDAKVAQDVLKRKLAYGGLERQERRLKADKEALEARGKREHDFANGVAKLVETSVWNASLQSDLRKLAEANETIKAFQVVVEIDRVPATTNEDGTPLEGAKVKLGEVKGFVHTRVPRGETKVLALGGGGGRSKQITTRELATGNVTTHESLQAANKTLFGSDSPASTAVLTGKIASSDRYEIVSN